MKPRIGELREAFAPRAARTWLPAAHTLYVEVIRLAYDLVTVLQRVRLPEKWQQLTLSQLRHGFFCDLTIHEPTARQPL